MTQQAPLTQAAFEKYFQAVERGDGTMPVPASANDSGWSEHMERRTAALGAWNHAAQLIGEQRSTVTPITPYAVYSRSEDDWSGEEDMGEVLQDLVDDNGGEGSVIFKGIAFPIPFRELVTDLVAGELFDRLEEELYEKLGEATENAFSGCDKTSMRNVIIQELIRQHSKDAAWFEIKDIEPIVVSQSMLDEHGVEG